MHFLPIFLYLPLQVFTLSLCWLSLHKERHWFIDRIPRYENTFAAKKKGLSFLSPAQMVPQSRLKPWVRGQLLAKLRESHFWFGLEHDSVIGAAERRPCRGTLTPPCCWADLPLHRQAVSGPVGMSGQTRQCLVWSSLFGLVSPSKSLADTFLIAQLKEGATNGNK